MAKYIPLNPFNDIMLSLEDFMVNNHAALSALMLRPYQGQATQRLREMNISTAILEDIRYVGIININIINEKFAQGNIVTTKERRYPNLDNAATEVNSDWFLKKFTDSRERLRYQLSFKQFRTDNLGISDVTYSTRYELFPEEADPMLAGKLTRSDTALLWNDPLMVLSIKRFWDVVSPILAAWVPDATDITTQTLFVD